MNSMPIEHHETKPSDAGMLWGKREWMQQWEQTEFTSEPSSHPILTWLAGFLPDGKGRSMIELGCFPGHFLPFFGHRNFVLNGVDFVPQVENDLPAWLCKQGFQNGVFRCADLRSFKPSEMYDVSASFGLIEHFENWSEILLLQARMVRPGGVLVVTTPNFARGFQYLFHRIFDSKNLRLHNVAAMRPEMWWRNLPPDFDVRFVGYIGSFDLWVGECEHAWQKYCWKLAWHTQALWRNLPFSGSWFAPYAGMIAVRRTK